MTPRRKLSAVDEQLDAAVEALLSAPDPEPLIQVDSPGVWNLDDASYHADPVPGGSLSASGCKALLPPSCPAKFAYQREHGRPPKREFDIGHAAHLEVLGKGAELVIAEYDNWMTNDAKALRAKAYEAGKTPLLAREHQMVKTMAETLRTDYPDAAALFDPASGSPEQALIWVDDRTGIWRRRRLDWLPRATTGRFLIADYKTCASAAPDRIRKAVVDFGYHLDAAWSIDGIRALGIDDDPLCLFVFQETTPPYVVTVAELSTLELRAGDHYSRKAIDVFVECSAADRWPAYADDIVLLDMPPWTERAYLEEIA